MRFLKSHKSNAGGKVNRVMNKQHSKIMILGLSAALLTGCTWVRGVNSADLKRYSPSKPSAAMETKNTPTPVPGATFNAAPDRIPQNTALHPMDRQALIAENNNLRKQQASNTKRLMALEKQLRFEQQAHQQFRTRMSSNLELLETSLANRLQGQQTSASPAYSNNGTSGAPKSRQTYRATGSSQGSSMSAKAQQLNGHSQLAIARAKRRVQGARPLPPGAYTKSMAGTLNARVMGIVNNPNDDPDLTPPLHPRTLSHDTAAKAMYERGFALFAQKRSKAALTQFNRLLQKYPSDVYSDNAQFWVGELYYRQGNKDAAEAAWRKVLRHYAHRSTLEGYKTPDALYRLGQVHLERKDTVRARQFLEAAVQRFPESIASKKAARTLSRIPATAAR